MLQEWQVAFIVELVNLNLKKKWPNALTAAWASTNINRVKVVASIAPKDENLYQTQVVLQPVIHFLIVLNVLLVNINQAQGKHFVFHVRQGNSKTKKDK